MYFDYGKKKTNNNIFCMVLKAYEEILLQVSLVRLIPVYETREETCSLLLEAKMTFITLYTEGSYLTDNISFSLFASSRYRQTNKKLFL